MKKIIISIIAMMMSAITAVAQTVAPRSTDYNREGEFLEACKAYFSVNPTDTLVEVREDTCQIAGVTPEYGDGAYAKTGDRKVIVIRYFLLPNGQVAREKANKLLNLEEILKIDPQFKENSTRTRFALHLDEGRRQDVNSFASLSNPELVFPARWADKDGWGLLLEASYQLFSGCNGLSGYAGLSYTAPFWRVDVKAGYCLTEYSSNATRAGEKYNAFVTQSGIYLQPIKFGVYDENRLYIGGGLGFERYHTDSKEWEDSNGGRHYMTSTGNYLFGHAGLFFEHRFWCTGNSLVVSIEARNRTMTIQNGDNETKWGVEAKVGFNFGIGRKKGNNHLGK